MLLTDDLKPGYMVSPFQDRHTMTDGYEKKWQVGGRKYKWPYQQLICLKMFCQDKDIFFSEQVRRGPEARTFCRSNTCCNWQEMQTRKYIVKNPSHSCYIVSFLVTLIKQHAVANEQLEEHFSSQTFGRGPWKQNPVLTQQMFQFILSRSVLCTHIRFVL